MTHGKSGTYVNQRCRCAECRAAWAAAILVSKRKRRARGQCVECVQPTGGAARCERHRLVNALRSQRNRRVTAALKARP